MAMKKTGWCDCAGYNAKEKEALVADNIARGVPRSLWAPNIFDKIWVYPDLVGNAKQEHESRYFYSWAMEENNEPVPEQPALVAAWECRNCHTRIKVGKYSKTGKRYEKRNAERALVKTLLDSLLVDDLHGCPDGEPEVNWDHA
jgi:hypothetical protein